MSHLSMILSVAFTLAMILLIAPNIIALNHGNILRNVAAWLAIFLGLALFYENFGPDSAHPLFQMPYGLSGMNRSEAPKLVVPATAFDKEDKSDSDNGEQGFTPPKE